MESPQLGDSNHSSKAPHHDHNLKNQLLNDTVRSLPSRVVNDLLSLGVCSRCIFRLFGIRGDVYSNSSLSPSAIRYVLGEGSGDCAGKESEPLEICHVCLGVLQFVYCDNKGALVTMQGPDELAASIAELAKCEGHCIDIFALEVSLPQSISENEQAFRLYVKRKYSSEVWLEQMVSKCLSIKEVLKFVLTTSLETLLGVRSGPSSFHVSLTYTHATPTSMGAISKGNGSCKRLKTGNLEDTGTVTSESLGTSSSPVDLAAAKVNSSCERSSNGSVVSASSPCLIFTAERASEPCHLVLQCCRTPICLVGRYLKFSRNVSQTRWIIDDERMGEASVEEIIGGNTLPMCRGDAYKFHAAGREDIDVRMLGSGRPFLVEIQNPRQLITEDAVKEIETRINNLENKLVGVRNLKVVASDCWTLMHEGEAEKQKQYCALVWISRSLKDEDVQLIASFKDTCISQKTPIRVLHRRSPLEREKTIHWMKIEVLSGSSQYFLLHLCTQAGTYIKEFVHGDLGRTHPSIGSILGCRAEIMHLDVTDVKMDCFPPP